MKNGSYPKASCKQRPFHLWDEKKKKRVRYRYFTYVTHACDRAMIETKRWSKIGETLTVYDSSTGVMVEQYTRRIKSLVIYKNPDWKGQS